ncbi:MAG: PQQ-binding-like beta-propeller repeat protein [Acidobacteriota bacterium]
MLGATARTEADLGWTSWLAAFSKVDGSQIWRTDWRGTCCTYSTPIVVERDGKEQIIIGASPKILGFDLETGEQLWSVDYPAVQVVPSPVVADDLLIVSGAVHDRLTAAFRLTGGGAETVLEPLWESNRAVPEIASPVLYDNTLYQVTEGGVATATQAEKGNLLKHWRLKLGPYRASMIAGDGKVYALSARGTVAVISKAPGPELVAENQMPVDTGPYLAMSASADCLLVRSRRALYCVDGYGPEPAADAAVQAVESPSPG